MPDEVVAAFGQGKKPKVHVTLNGFLYRSTVAAYSGVYMLPLSQERRQAAGAQAGDLVKVTLELDVEPRTAPVPADLAEVLSEAPGAMAAFEALLFSARKEFVRQVEEAKAQETRSRRIAGVVAKLTNRREKLNRNSAGFLFPAAQRTDHRHPEQKWGPKAERAVSQRDHGGVAEWDTK